MTLTTKVTAESMTFDAFKKAVAEQVIKNLSFNLIVDGQEHTTFNSLCERKITSFIKDILQKLPIHFIQAINSLNHEEKFTELVNAVAGSGKRELRVNFKNGAGLHFSGLTKLCYDVSHHHPKAAYQHPGFPTLLHINEISLFKIKDPLQCVNNLLTERFSKETDFSIPA